MSGCTKTSSIANHLPVTRIRYFINFINNFGQIHILRKKYDVKTKTCFTYTIPSICLIPFIYSWFRCFDDKQFECERLKHLAFEVIS